MKNKPAKLFMTTLIAGSITAVLAQSPYDFNLSKNTAEAAKAASASSAEQRYIIKFKDNSPYTVMSANGQAKLGSSADQLMAKTNARIMRKLPNSAAIAAMLTPKSLAAIQSNPNVEYVEVDPIRYIQASPSPMAESTPYGIQMVQADQVSDSLTGNMKVCIVDTGYELGHEDLISSGVTGDDNDGNGNDTGNWYQPGHPHGTHVAGTIAALGGNNVGVVGVNPSGNLGLHIVKVFNNAGSWGYGSDLVAAVNQCVSAGSDVISMSLGGGASSTAERNAFASALNNGVLSIAAAGNSGNSSLSYPASYDEVMSVAAVNSSGTRASFSQYNSQVEIAAPGVSVLSTVLNDGYASYDGTSMATPHVSGVAALVWSHYPSCSASQIRAALNATAEDRGSAGRDTQYGWGIVKAKAAYDYLANGCDGGGNPPPPPPGGDTELTNGQTVSNLSGSQGSEAFFTLDVPAGATDLTFQMAGGSGDADMYVRFGSKPTTSTYECRPYLNGNNETCNISNVQAGTYYVMLRGYSAFSGTSLVGSFNESSGGNGGTFNKSNLQGASGSWQHFTVQIPQGMSSFTIDMAGGSGDADMYVRRGSQPTTSSYDCRPYRWGNTESCSFNNPASGTWYISVRGYSTYSGVGIDAEWNP
ncbi:S8 family serine peptidase [Pleionea litopenaei]|uniref:S8 family serine peptidase n=1 Tax=Pleionea litopenaei TaxID=3070815 RepID=A0AA51X6E9_9GAMM|nr:S8 family serine peptidase [Pleionea sp. HL-JVS1]WMS86020.1 S8 family serine peptidase [Pleionea sp. HL-JVS1]